MINSMDTIHLLFSGDLAPIGRVEESCLQNKQDEFINEIKPLLNSTDLHITNLECPLTNSQQKIDKSGPAIKAKPETIRLLKSLKIGLACMANNHIRDYGNEGINDTIQLCTKNDIMTSGAGINEEAARKITYITLKNKTLAFINYCEEEFSIAGYNSAGGNPIDPIQAYYDILQATKITSLIFVIIHGGHEEYALPSPRIKKLFHFMADMGAAAVIGHHPHVVSGVENYNGKPLIYSLGNFIFDEPGNKEEWYTGALASIMIAQDNSIELQMKYINQSKEKLQISYLEGEQLIVFENIVKVRSEIIANDESLSQAWINFANQLSKGFIKQIMSFTKAQRALFKLGLFKSVLLKKQKILPKLNIIQCESHRDILIHSLKNTQA